MTAKCLVSLSLLIAIGAHAADTTQTASTADSMALDQRWLETVWTQIDSMVQKEEFELQKIVTAAGSRGAEAEEDLLSQMGYESKPRSPDKADLAKAIAVLQQQINADPQSDKVPRLQFYIAQCLKQLGRLDKARAAYEELIAKHPGSTWAAKAQKAHERLAAPVKK